MEPIPFEAIEASRKMIASGGTAQDIGLPPLTQPDWKNVKRVSKIEKADFEYKARPVSAPTDPLERVSLAPDTPRDTGIMSPQLTIAGGSIPGVRRFTRFQASKAMGAVARRRCCSTATTSPTAKSNRA